VARILMLADAGCTTGFGRVSQAIGDRLVEQYGHDIHVIAVNYEGDYWPTKMKLYLPDKRVKGDIYGQSRIVELLGEVLPDVVFMLNDPYIVLRILFRNKHDPEVVLARLRPIIAYMPVDGYDFPAVWGQLPELVASTDQIEGCPPPSFHPVVMSRHGRTMFPNADLIYHGVDTETFRPVTPKNPIIMSNGTRIESKADAKRALSLDPDAFLVLRVDRNSYRKNFADTWKALVPLMKRYSNIHAWFHCKAEGDSIELPQVFGREPSVADRFHFPGSYSTKIGWNENDLLAVYNAADMFVSTSQGEGFGLTLAEAAACGLPIVAQNVSSIPEVVGPGGILLEPERRITVDSGQDLWLPNVASFTEAIERLYLSRGMRRDLGEAGRAHISGLTWDEAAKRFDELITKVTQETPAPPSGERIEHAPAAASGAK